MIARDKYLKELIATKNNGFPKVITGIRRCGKSFLLKDIFSKYLREHGVQEKEILMIELDDDKNASLRNPIELGKYVRRVTAGNKMNYVILDEIQRVYTIVNPDLVEGKIVLAKKTDTETISFVDVVLGLSHEKNIDLYVTGSNSKMLSTDIVTEFRDKATNIHVSPLSFEEYSNYVGGSKFEALSSYMQYGGMPLAAIKNEEDRKKYLTGLFETTYFKDILEHNKLMKTESLDELCNVISSCTGELLNSGKIANTFRSVKREDINQQTVDKYIQFFVDAFLLREAKRYDLRGRNEIGALRKYYFLDTGLRNARLNFAYSDEGLLLENVIYNELIYHGYSVNVGTFDSVEKDRNGKSIRKTNEIDFYARKGNRHYYIQVTDNIGDAKTKAREYRPFFMINDQVQKILVINRPIPETRDENGFTVIGAVDFMLRFIK
ncbi:MAG: ATP-binding protein [Bacilli bacterium]|nr:ATP-binding protein [Bacilli bacterium]